MDIPKNKDVEEEKDIEIEKPIEFDNKIDIEKPKNQPLKYSIQELFAIGQTVSQGRLSDCIVQWQIPKKYKNFARPQVPYEHYQHQNFQHQVNYNNQQHQNYLPSHHHYQQVPPAVVAQPQISRTTSTTTNWSTGISGDALIDAIKAMGTLPAEQKEKHLADIFPGLIQS